MKYIWHINVSNWRPPLPIVTHCKLAHHSQSQNCATFPFHIRWLLWINYLFVLCPEVGLNLVFFKLTFGPLIHLQYIKILIKAFLQSCRYRKYFFLQLNSHPCNFGLSNLHFPATFFLSNFSLSRNQNWSLLRQN